MGKSKERLEEMTFWGHIDVLRKLLLRMAVVVFAFAVILFIFMPWIFDNFILAPTHRDFFLYRLFDNISGGLMPDLFSGNFSIELINIELASQFFIHMSTSCWLAVVLAFPFLISMIWGFISPALYNHEKRGFKRAFAFGNIMFYLGVAVGYSMVFPITMRFLAEYQISESVPNIISLDSYMDNFIMICLMMGLVFELPLLAWLLGKMGLLTKSFFTKYRRHAIVILLILAAIITPTGDPFTLSIVFIPIYALWELSTFLVPQKQTTEQ
ncbi:MAG: twin-arginine translocase subunit TatC [Muribaculaceae bacterium]|nr:twin-arginine translocase subunit TatC [Muribaculaceae bacterium]